MREFNENLAPRKEETRTRKFWRVVFGSMLGFFFCTVLVTVLYVVMLLGMISSIGSTTNETSSVKENTILKIDLSKQISERSIDNPFESMYSSTTSVGLNDILAAIKAAASDPKIKGIYLCSGNAVASPATLKEIHDALLLFKESGKFVYAYGDGYNQNGYYIASVADQVVMNPTGNLALKGYAFQVMFYKGLLEKLDVDVQIIRHGKFKSAVEPYMLDKMSDANREQYTLLANTLWSCISQDLSASRNISEEKLNEIVDNISAFSADSALQLNLVDKLAYRSDVEKMLKSEVNSGEEAQLNYVSVAKYAKSVKNTDNTSDKIAVVYAVGQINDGKGDHDSGIYSESFIKEFKKAVKNNNVKAIVLRVNSPGGSALASENIWREIENARQAGKVVVTSMGDYAASGGYYISCNSDYIFAQPNTLTGSIGVFGVVPSIQNTLKNKLGVTVDVVKTNPHADMLTVYRPMDETEQTVMQQMVDETYGIFTQRVADGRKMRVSQVDSIGQGRVWAGKDALDLGLVDQLGSLNDAIQKAADLVDIDQYSIVYYPRQKSFFEKIMDKYDEDTQTVMKTNLGTLYPLYQELNNIMTQQGVQARIPAYITIQ